MFSDTPTPPYYAVIFTSIENGDNEEYSKMSERMIVLSSQQPGFLGIESARSEIGITVSYWKDLNSIQQWKANAEHLEAQNMGKEKWYEKFKVRIALVEREYGFVK